MEKSSLRLGYNVPIFKISCHLIKMCRFESGQNLDIRKNLVCIR